MGSLADFEPGTVERAKVVSIRVLDAWSLANSTKEKWELDVALAKRERAHELLGFEDFDAYLKALVGETTPTVLNCLKHDWNGATGAVRAEFLEWVAGQGERQTVNT